ncbi:FtsX-like permease family protein [Marinoscillum pacificum]|uniref:FtsX-like permease family protein n=1 Tax=Marinoscillum pacificum TaxID=392723 RepID=UPI00215786A9|nr:FtsX-like permease family protein [Marinoscillum pacificum]
MSKQNKPPKLAQELLHSFLKDELLEEVLGDLEEKLEVESKKRSLFRAKLNYWWQVLHYFRPFAFRKTQKTHQLMLFRNYLKVAFRLFAREKSFSLINVFGLAVGIACSLFILLWVQDELQYNAFLDSGDRVCNVLNREFQTNGEVNTYRYSSYNLKAVLEEEYPIVEQATIMSNGNWMAFELDHNLVEWAGVDASPEFFEVFEVPIMKGHTSKMFDDPYTLAISSSFAETYFGSDWQSKDIVGTVMVNDRDETYELVAVYEDLPPKSTLSASFVVPFANRIIQRPNLTSWRNSSSQLYVKLIKDVSLIDANDYMVNSIMDHRSGDYENRREVFLQPFEDMYLFNRYENGTITGGRIEYVRLLSFAAIFVLILASINFMNLTTARATRRAKETGVRKVLGALKGHLRIQFLTESVLLTAFSVLLAVLIVWLMAPYFGELVNKEFEWSFTWKMLLFIPVFILSQGILSGVYPAFFLSSLKVISSLKSGMATPQKHNGLRKALVVFQFVITLVLIVGALTVYQQVEYIRTKNIGLDRSNVIRSYIYDMTPMDCETYRTELLKKPGIENVSMVTQLAIDVKNATSGIGWEGKQPGDRLEFYHMDVDPWFIPTMKIEMALGRNFDSRITADTLNYIINETAARQMGLVDPIGKSMNMWGQKGKIIGMVKDFHNASLHSAIEPLILRYNMHNLWMVLARSKPGQDQDALTSLEAVFKDYSPARTFWYRYVDELYDSQYKSELMIRDLSWCFTVVAIVISLLGLLALVAYSAERRRKEVGIRKVLGATVSDIMKLLSSEYMLLLTIAMVVAFPLAYFAMSDWLNGFVYHIDLGWWLFAMAGLLTLLLALGIISLKISKLANSNPVGYLRDE